MQREQSITFRPFRLDLESERLWCRSEPIALRPKTFAVLRHLLERAGRLVTKDELLDAVWPDTSVSDVVPIVCVRELRQALGDQAEAPTFIETVPRRGYRFIGKISTPHQMNGVKPERALRAPAKFSLLPSLTAATLVGREDELAQLRRGLETARRGERQVVFVTGEAGIGKTAVVEAFLKTVERQKVWIARGQCLEYYGAGEAYMPVLDAIGRLCRAASGDGVRELLGRYAPTWLAQIPWLLDSVPSADQPQPQSPQRTTSERMLREMAEAVEALSHERPLVIVLEDLQWSDSATLDLLTFLARRRERGRILLIGTYRFADISQGDHRLRDVMHELQLHRQGKELPLPLLTAAAVAVHLDARFPTHTFPTGLAGLIHQRTDGNPLFMVNVLDDLVTQGVIVEREGRWQLTRALAEVEVGVPESVRQMLSKRIDRLSHDEQRVLEAASVVGVEFSTAAVAAGLEVDVVQVEEWCEDLARHNQFLRPGGVGEWPDGTVAAQYAFTHALYRHALYQRVTGARRARFHQRIGARAETGYGERAGEQAAELAMHFEQGRDHTRAVTYLQQAAENAIRRSAFPEAIAHFTKGLGLLNHWPETPARTRQELSLHITVIGPLMALKGESSAELERIYTQIGELSRRLGETTQSFWVLTGLCMIHLFRGELRQAYDLGEQMLLFARQRDEPVFLLWAQYMLGATVLCRSDFVAALARLEEALVLYEAQQHPRYLADPKVGCLGFLALTRCGLGYLDQAVQNSEEALALAREAGPPYGIALALTAGAGCHILRRDSAAAQQWAEELIALSREYGLMQYQAQGVLHRGGALVERGEIEEGIAQMRQGLADLQASGADLGVPAWSVILAAALARLGRIAEGLRTLDEAEARIARDRGRFYEAELYRLRGELILQQESPKSKVQSPKSKVQTDILSPPLDAQGEAEGYFLKAIDIARAQNAKLFELRATMSLSRLWQEQGKRADAHRILAAVYGWFTEGFESVDLKEARDLLVELKE
ncbi:MAG: AAA family ATPase [Deltaproteobacteria bacterium]|nr:AAA family ATPase [Deltaproteobacteria bacterium]